MNNKFKNNIVFSLTGISIWLCMCLIALVLYGTTLVPYVVCLTSMHIIMILLVEYYD